MPFPALPPRPLRLSAGFVRRSIVGTALCVVFCLAACVGYPAWQAFQARAILDDEALWNGGLAARQASAEGKETSHDFILNEYDVVVTYRDQAGHEHKGRTKFDTLFSSIDANAQPVVHYDPREPERFALSWAHDQLSGRWASVAGLALVGAAIGIVLLFEARQLLRRLAAARRAAVASDEVELAIARIVRVSQYGRATGLVRYYYRVPTPSGEKQREIAFNAKKGHKPLFADAEETRLLALRSAEAPDRPVVLRNDLYPFETR
jgi:hypothetical protein